MQKNKIEEGFIETFGKTCLIERLTEKQQEELFEVYKKAIQTTAEEIIKDLKLLTLETEHINKIRTIKTERLEEYIKCLENAKK